MTTEQRKQRWQTFLALGAPEDSMCFVRHTDPDVPRVPCPPRWPEKRAECIEWAWREYEIACAQAALSGGAS